MKYYVAEIYNNDNEIFFDMLKDDIADNFSDSIFIGGNRDYIDINFDLIKLIKNNIIDYSSYEIEVYYKNNFAAYIIELLKPYKKISLKQALKIISIIKKYDYKCDVIDEILTVIYCKLYHKTTLRGYSQGDWIYCYYESSLHNYIKYAEAVLFNTGVCIEIHDGDNIPETPEDINGYGDYILNGNIDDKKAAVASMLNCNKDDIVYYEIKDVKQYTSYNVIYNEGV